MGAEDKLDKYRIRVLDRTFELLDLLAASMGSGRASRLYRAVRERRHASSVSAYNYTPTEIGVFVLHAESPVASASDALRAMWDQVRAVRDGDLGELEVRQDGWRVRLRR